MEASQLRWLLHDVVALDDEGKPLPVRSSSGNAREVPRFAKAAPDESARRLLSGQLPDLDAAGMRRAARTCSSSARLLKFLRAPSSFRRAGPGHRGAARAPSYVHKIEPIAEAS